jgi:hypothetical protein
MANFHENKIKKIIQKIKKKKNKTQFLLKKSFKRIKLQKSSCFHLT